MTPMTAQTGQPGQGPEETHAAAGAAEEALTEAAFRTGDFDRAQHLYERLLVAGDPRSQARALFQLGMIDHYRNITRWLAGQTIDEAVIAPEEDLMRRALELWQRAGDTPGTAMGLFGMGMVHQVLRQDWDAAMPYFWPAFGLAEAVEESGDLQGAAEIHRHIGFYYASADDRPAEAVRRQAYSLALRERIGDPRLIPSALVALGEAEVKAGNPARAVELLRPAVEQARSLGLLDWRIRFAQEALDEAVAAQGEAAPGRAGGS